MNNEKGSTASKMKEKLVSNTSKLSNERLCVKDIPCLSQIVSGTKSDRN